MTTSNTNNSSVTSEMSWLDQIQKHTEDFVSGGYNYFRGLERAARHSSILKGQYGQEAQQQAVAINDIVEQLFDFVYHNPQYLYDVVYFVLKKQIEDQPFELLGRAVPGMVITNATGGLGFPLATLSLLGDLVYNIEQGIIKITEVKELLEKLNQNNLIQNNLQPHCFTAETPILMSDGTYKPIAEIKIGDEVMAFEGLGELQPCKVIATSIKPDQEVIQLGNIKVTPGHQFLLPDGSFQSIGEVDVNGYLVGVTGKLIPHPGAKPVPGKHTVYNITVKGLHTYVAGDYRVHNDSLSNYLPVTTAGFLGASLAGQIASYYADDKFASQLIAQSLGETFGGWVGDAINYELYRPESLSLSALYTRLPASFIGNAISLGSSKLAENIIKTFEIEEPLVQQAVSTVVNTTSLFAVQSIVASYDPDIAVKFFGAPYKEVGGVFEPLPLDFTQYLDTLKNAGYNVIASYAATELYEGLIRWNVLSENYSAEGSAIGGAIGSTVGGVIGSFFGVPIIGSAIGKLIGNILGGIFGDDDPTMAIGYIYPDYQSGLFKVSPLDSRLPGDYYNLAKQMSESAQTILNGLILSIGGELIYAKGGGYGHYKKYHFHLEGERRDPEKTKTAEGALNWGILRQAKIMQIEGGDLYLKRALLTSDTTRIEALGKDLEVAREYGVYKDNPALYEATIKYLDDNAVQLADQSILDLRQNPDKIPQLPEDKDDQFVDFDINTLPSQVSVSRSSDDFIVNGQVVKPNQVIRFADGSLFEPVVHQDGSITLEAQQVANWWEVKPRAQQLNLDAPQASDTYAGSYVDIFKGDFTNIISGDFNGDGKTDFIRQEKNTWDRYQSQRAS